MQRFTLPSQDQHVLGRPLLVNLADPSLPFFQGEQVTVYPLCLLLLILTASPLEQAFSASRSSSFWPTSTLTPWCPTRLLPSPWRTRMRSQRASSESAEASPRPAQTSSPASAGLVLTRSSWREMTSPLLAGHGCLSSRCCCCQSCSFPYC